MSNVLAEIKSRPSVILEPAARDLAEMLAAAGGDPLYTLTPEEARAVLTGLQSGPIAMADAEIEEHAIPGGTEGTISITVVKPVGHNGRLPVVVYTHGGGWILGSFATHERLVRDLTAQTGAAFVFVNYPNSPEAQFPVAIEQVYATILWVSEYGAELGLDPDRIAIAGESVGGNMTAAVAIMAKERGGPKIRFQALLYPVTSARFDTASYQEFADGPWLTMKAMQWFWDAYLPDPAMRLQPIASPLEATLDQLRGLPPTLVLTDEADVLRDEGEAYARKLREAAVDVTAIRYEGVFHDFMMLNALADTNASRLAIAQTSQLLKKALFP